MTDLDFTLYLKHVGQQIGIIRVKKGISQAELGRQCGYQSKKSMNCIEQGKMINVSLKTLCKIAEVLDVDLIDILLSEKEFKQAFCKNYGQDVEELVTKYCKMSEKNKGYLCGQLDLLYQQNLETQKKESR